MRSWRWSCKGRRTVAATRAAISSSARGPRSGRASRWRCRPRSASASGTTTRDCEGMNGSASSASAASPPCRFRAGRARFGRWNLHGGAEYVRLGDRNELVLGKTALRSSSRRPRARVLVRPAGPGRAHDRNPGPAVPAPQPTAPARGRARRASRRHHARRRRPHLPRALFGSRRRAAAAPGVPRRRARTAPVAVVALGGYGRRHLCLHSDIDLLVLFGERDRRARGGVPPRVAAPAVGRRRRGRPPGARAGRVRAAGARQSGVPAGARRRAAVAGSRELFDRLARRLPHRRARTRSSSTRCYQLADERHAAFNDTLYQLEPDVKEAPGALRDLAATRTIAPADRSAAAAQGARPSRRASTTPRTSCCACARRSTLETGRNQNVLGHELQERIAELMGYPGTEPRQRVERLMSDYFRHARIVEPRRSAGRGGRRRVPVGPEPRAVARRHRLPRSDAGGTHAGVVDRRVRGRRRARHRGVRGSAVAASSSTWIAIAPTTSFPRPPSAPRWCVPRPAPGLYDRLSRDARLRPARAGVPRVPGDLVARGARLLPQVHGRRAHAAHHPQPRTARRRPSGPTASASATCSTSWRRRSCWCWRCCCTTSASGATTITKSRASAWPRACWRGCR